MNQNMNSSRHLWQPLCSLKFRTHNHMCSFRIQWYVMFFGYSRQLGFLNLLVFPVDLGVAQLWTYSLCRPPSAKEEQGNTRDCQQSATTHTHSDPNLCTRSKTSTAIPTVTVGIGRYRCRCNSCGRYKYGRGACGRRSDDSHCRCSGKFVKRVRSRVCEITACGRVI